MGRIEQRAAKRVECEFPTRLSGTDGCLDAVVCDLSRTGVKLRIPGATLGIHRLSSLVQVAQRVSESLGDAFIADLHHERLGDLVSKTLKPIRIGQRNWEQADVELGCRVGEGITDDEAGMLGVALPKVGAIEAPSYLTGAGPEVRPAPNRRDAKDENTPVVADASERSSPRPDSADLTGHQVGDRHHVYIEGRSGGTGASFEAHTEGVTPEGAVLRIRNIEQLLAAESTKDVSRFVMAFDAMYGERLSLRIMDGARHVWSGPAVVRCMELPPEAPGTALLTVAYSRTLCSAELREFGLV